MYSGGPDESFDGCFRTYQGGAAYAGITDDKDSAMLISKCLKGAALAYFDQTMTSNGNDLHRVCCAIRAQFHTPETDARLRYRWEKTIITSVLKRMAKERKQPSLEQAFDETYRELRDIQEDLPPGVKSNSEMHIRLFHAMKGIEECEPATINPPPTVAGLAASIRLVIQKKSSSQAKPFAQISREKCEPESHFIDRYFRHTPGIRGNRNQGQDTWDYRWNPPGYGQSPRGRMEPKDNRSFVCFDRNCYSTNHPQEEHEKAYAKILGKKARAYFANTLVDDEVLWNAAGIDDPNAFIANFSFPCDESPDSPPLTFQDQDQSDNRFLEDFETPHSGAFFLGCDDTDTTTELGFYRELLNASAFHAITKERPRIGLKWHENRWIMIDTGAAKGNTAGKAQVIAMQDFLGFQAPQIKPNKEPINCNFGIGSAKSEVIITLGVPIGYLTAQVSFHVVPADIPFILCIDDMDRIGVHLINTRNILYHEATGEFSEVTRFFNHPFLLWDPASRCFFSRAELERLHRRFNHPSPEKLYTLLCRAEAGRENSHLKNNTHDLVQLISKRCGNFWRRAAAPQRFRFRMKDADDTEFTR